MVKIDKIMIIGQNDDIFLQLDSDKLVESHALE